MNRTHVSSSNLKSVGYDPMTKILEIEFHSCSVYQYSNVPPTIYKGLMSAASHGSYFNATIRGAFPYIQVR
ncbi:MAG: KTSC domain-containing protein [Armatimonadota bacterium]